MSYEKPIPRIGIHTRPFWEGTKAGKLMLPRCQDCNRVHWYPRHICPHCHSDNLEWVEGSGRGTLYAFAVQHLVFGPWAKEAPYVTAYVDLAEGDRMLTVLRGVDPERPEDIPVGAAVQVEFEEAGDDLCIPYWRIVAAAEEGVQP